MTDYCVTTQSKMQKKKLSQASVRKSIRKIKVVLVEKCNILVGHHKRWSCTTWDCCGSKRTANKHWALAHRGGREQLCYLGSLCNFLLHHLQWDNNWGYNRVITVVPRDDFKSSESNCSKFYYEKRMGGAA